MICRADLSGDDSCTAAGLTARSSSPIIALCRMMIDAGYDPSTCLQVYRGDVLALTVATIGIGARLEVNSKGNGFRWATPVRAASLSDLNEREAA